MPEKGNRLPPARTRLGSRGAPGGGQAVVMTVTETHAVTAPSAAVAVSRHQALRAGALQPRVSVIIPTLNEARNLPHVLAARPAGLPEVIPQPPRPRRRPGRHRGPVVRARPDPRRVEPEHVPRRPPGPEDHPHRMAQPVTPPPAGNTAPGKTAVTGQNRRFRQNRRAPDNSKNTAPCHPASRRQRDSGSFSVPPGGKRSAIVRSVPAARITARSRWT